jgi:hypothetical protein
MEKCSSDTAEKKDKTNRCDPPNCRHCIPPLSSLSIHFLSFSKNICIRGEVFSNESLMEIYYFILVFFLKCGIVVNFFDIDADKGFDNGLAAGNREN